MENLGDSKRPTSAMDELISSLEIRVEQLQKNVSGYRSVLKKLQNVELSWEEPQTESNGALLEDSAKNGTTTHLNRVMRVLDRLTTIVNKQDEILDHYNKLI